MDFWCDDLDDQAAVVGLEPVLQNVDGGIHDGDDPGLRRAQRVHSLPGEDDAGGRSFGQVDVMVAHVVDTVQIEGVVRYEDSVQDRFELPSVDGEKREVRGIGYHLDDIAFVRYFDDAIAYSFFQERVGIRDESLARIGRDRFGVVREADETCRGDDGYQHGDDKHVAVFHLNHCTRLEDLAAPGL